MLYSTSLHIGTEGTFIPEPNQAAVDVPSRFVPTYAPPGHPELVKSILRIPLLRSCIAGFATSTDEGDTWIPLMGFLNLTGIEPVLSGGSTVGGFTGSMELYWPPLLPGMMVRMTSDTDQGMLYAAKTTNMSNALADVTLTAVAPGAAGNSISVTYLDPGGVTAALAVTVVGFDITVSLARAGSAITSTAAEVVAAINASGAVNIMVEATDEGDGSGVVNAVAKANLAGGEDAMAVPMLLFGI